MSDKEIYILRWIPNGTISAKGLAFTDKERAEKCAEYNNKKLKWYQRLTGGQWVVSSLRLRTGRGKVHNV